MSTVNKFSISDAEKMHYIDALTPELNVLRTKAGVSQEELSNIIGTSRQTYGSIERKTRKMSWNTYISLIMFYDYNKKTHAMVRRLAGFPHELIKKFNDGEEPLDLELGMLFDSDEKNIVDSLDEKALETIKTIVMVEYSRCNNISGEAVVKFFEGIDFSNKEKKDEDTSKALKNLKRKNK